MTSINDIINILSKYNTIILLIFSAKWCGPCKNLKAKLTDQNDKLVNKIKDMKYIIFDIDDEDNDELCSYFNVSGIPDQIFVKLDENNQLIVLDKIVGYNFELLVDKFITYNQ